MNFKRKKYQYILFGLLILAVVIISELYRKKIADLPKKYTIGQVTDFVETKSSGSKVVVTFFFMSKKHTISEYRKPEIKLWEKYVVEVPVGAEDMAKTLFNYPVPKNIKAPPEGWSELPDIDQLK